MRYFLRGEVAQSNCLDQVKNREPKPSPNYARRGPCTPSEQPNHNPTDNNVINSGY